MRRLSVDFFFGTLMTPRHSFDWTKKRRDER